MTDVLTLLQLSLDAAPATLDEGDDLPVLGTEGLGHQPPLTRQPGPERNVTTVHIVIVIPLIFHLQWLEYNSRITYYVHIKQRVLFFYRVSQEKHGFVLDGQRGRGTIKCPQNKISFLCTHCGDKCWISFGKHTEPKYFGLSNANANPCLSGHPVVLQFCILPLTLQILVLQAQFGHEISQDFLDFYSILKIFKHL